MKGGAGKTVDREEEEVEEEEGITTIKYTFSALRVFSVHHPSDPRFFLQAFQPHQEVVTSTHPHPR